MPAGRPTKYNPVLLPLIQKLFEMGATDEEVAQACDVHRDTIYEWRKKHPEFSDTTKVGKALADEQMVNSLYKQGIGYNYDVEVKSRANPNDKSEDDGKITLTKYSPPNVVATIFWLKNRLPKRFRDRIEVEHTHTIEDGIRGKANELESDGTIPGADHDIMDIHCECLYCRLRRGQVDKQIPEAIE